MNILSYYIILLLTIIFKLFIKLDKNMINAAILGLGWWGKHITETLSKSSLIQIKAACSRTKEKHTQFIEEHNLKYYKNYIDLLSDNEIDAIIICTPNSQHEEQALMAIDAKKQVFCEKPMTLKSKSANNMINAAKKSKLILGIGHERRFDPAMEMLKKTIEHKSFGKKMHIEANWSHDILAGLDSDNWRGTSDEAPAAGMTGTGVHMTDLFLSMFGSVEGLFAQSSSRVLKFETGDLCTVMMRFKSGATGQLSVLSKTPYYCRLTAFGDNIWSEVRDIKHPMFKGKTEFTLCRIGEEPEKTLYPAIDTIKSNLEEWSLAILNRGSYRFTDKEKIENIALLEAIDQSILDNKWIKL
ncbi:MAG: hypothetical protein CML83_02045 [Rhodobiaceae bacterium]|uniref:Gfo/Idh/MocA family oxidoreductase n=1 Tax=PS1 clade bacterium TaxID=2175152 RepID=A0A368DTL3_9PROT|nr:hypothetical protein [Rhodobiaceae bacterium]OUT74762.1 MAG: hypothetical protein CBB85_01865 [Rhizobiales bacterium TMED25]RCL74656.1 MAG: gfo/Idh/MocA family oxidoreductase [PS1 clade bacterium]